MTANVALTDTFDQWRVKDNELIIMTQPQGMNNFIKVLDTGNSTSNTTGSILTAGGLGIAKSVTIGENLTVHGNTVIDGDTTISGNLTFGDATTDQVVFSADINSDIIPNANVIFNLGNTSMFWANTWTGHLGAKQKSDSGKPAITVTALDTDVVAVDIDATTITANVLDITADSVTSATGIKLSMAGLTTGTMVDLVSASAITGVGLNVALDSLTTGKAVNISADGLTTGSALYVDSNSSDTSARNLVSIIQDNSSATGSIALYVQQDGVAPVGKFSGTTALVTPVGTTNNRGTATQGGIRFNSEHANFEGYSGASWLSLGGIIDVDRDTKITAETSEGADNDDLDFYTAGTQRMKIDQAGVVTVGVDDTGYDVKFFGATTGKYMLWDEDQDKLVVSGDATISGDLTINGTTSTINSTTLTVDDKNIEMGSVASPSDTTADGGGLTLKGATDKTILWTNSLDSWVFNQGITVGVDDTGYDVKLFGATSGKYTLWDESADTLYVSGTCSVTTLVETSTRTVKTNIVDMGNMLPAVMQMRGVKFDYKDETMGKGNYGLIAEEVEEILPTLVSHNENGDAQGIQYTKLTAVLVEAIKEQQSQINELKSMILN
jgi:hypothetical protein